MNDEPVRRLEPRLQQRGRRWPFALFGAFAALALTGFAARDGNGQGRPNVVPLLDRPDRNWKRAVFSQFPRPVRVSVPGARAEPDDKMGYAMRTDRYLYVEWRFIQDPNAIAAVELYDHAKVPLETDNVAAEPAYAHALGELRDIMQAGWRAAVPTGTND